VHNHSINSSGSIGHSLHVLLSTMITDLQELMLLDISNLRIRRLL